MKKSKTELISSCINNNSESFLSFLMSSQVQWSWIKMDFYHFFKDMLNKAHITEKETNLKIEDSTDDIDKVTCNYSFYDNVKHYLLLIKLKKTTIKYF
jgi:hypothetical protein